LERRKERRAVGLNDVFITSNFDVLLFALGPGLTSFLLAKDQPGTKGGFYNIRIGFSTKHSKYYTRIPGSLISSAPSPKKSKIGWGEED